MTRKAREKAERVLLDKCGVLGEEARLPRVYVVGNEVAIFMTAALRYQRNHYCLYGEKLRIEMLTFQKAYANTHDGAEVPEHIDKMIDKNFDSIGTLMKHGENWYQWQVEQYEDNHEISSSIFHRV